MTDVVRRDEAALSDVDLADALRELEIAERRASRHLLWATLGLSPAALIPFVGLLAEGSLVLVVVLTTLVFFVEGWRHLRASKEAKRLRAVVARLEVGQSGDLSSPEDEPPAGPTGEPRRRSDEEIVT